MKKIIVTALIIGILLVVGAAIVLYPKKKDALSHCSIKHLGIIMDGNRRWARKNGFKPWIGHQHGVAPVKVTINFCLLHKIPYVTLYAFSLENFKRPQEELHYLFDVLAQELAHKELNTLFEKGVRVTFVGDRNQFPAQLQETIKTIEEKTAQNSTLFLNILFCYGGQQEIIAATKKIAQHVAHGLLKPENITSEIFEEHLWLGKIPSPDLVIRTGGAKRLSNFLTYQSAYSELIFLDCYWPELTDNDLIAAVNEYETVRRNFGA